MSSETLVVDEAGQVSLASLAAMGRAARNVGRLCQALHVGVEAGTVDKFQGREAPVVIYTMATSTPDGMPRDTSFLFSLSRFNVATSRAQALVVLVCSRALLTVSCRTPEQMRLANAMAWFVEMATGA